MRARHWLAVVVALFADGVLALPNIEHWQMDNGANVYLIQKHNVPMVDVAVRFLSGSSRDGNASGLAYLVSQMLKQGSDGMSADAINIALESTGAIVTTDTGRDYSGIQLRSLSDERYLNKALAIAAKILGKPDFSKADVAREKGRLVVSIQNRLQNPRSVANDALFAALYDSHPYAMPVLGSESSVQRINRAMLRAFHTRYYVGQNATVTIVGAVDRASANRIAKELLAYLPEGKIPKPVPAVFPPKGTAKTMTVPFPSSQVHILGYTLGVRRGDPDFIPLQLGNYVLGGGSLVSRLFSEVREKRGLSYGASSYFYPLKEQGPYIAALQTNVTQKSEAFTVLDNTIRQFMTDGPSTKELALAKNHFIGSFALSLDSSAELLNLLTIIACYGLPLDYLNSFVAHVQSVNTDEVRAAFQQHVMRMPLRFIFVGPEGLAHDPDAQYHGTKITSPSPSSSSRKH